MSQVRQFIGVVINQSANYLACLMVCLFVSGCSVFPKKEFVPVDAERLVEWSVEGSIELEKPQLDEKAFFSYENLDGAYRLTVHPNEPLEQSSAMVSGVEGDTVPAGAVQANDEQANKFLDELLSVLPVDSFSYWARGLPVTGEAQIIKNEDQQVTKIQELGWEIEYDGYMQVEQYALPDKIRMQKQAAELDIEIVRAETGFLSSPCPNVDVSDSRLSKAADMDNDNGSESRVEQLVPADDRAPLPRWIDTTDFCAQLIKVHGKVPNRRVGLYGPDSMMWKLSGPLAPGGMGAGRALLLQTAHPWITAGIDEHSIVRYDPMERARRTFTNVSTLVYGSMPQVLRAAHKVHKTHEEIKGKIPYHAGAFKQGSEYRANEINAMIWVHATLWETLVTMYEKLEEPLSQAEKNRFYEETKLFAMMFGIPESALPRDWDEFMAYNQAMWNSAQLTVTDNARILKEDLFTPKSIFLIFPLWIQETVTAAHLPPRIRKAYGMEYDTWEKFNSAWLMASAKLANWMLPDYLGVNAVKHEAEARLKGERVDAYHQMLIEAFLGTERLVN